MIIPLGIAHKHLIVDEQYSIHYRRRKYSFRVRVWAGKASVPVVLITHPRPAKSRLLELTCVIARTAHAQHVPASSAGMYYFEQFKHGAVSFCRFESAGERIPFAYCQRVAVSIHDVEAAIGHAIEEG